MSLTMGSGSWPVRNPPVLWTFEGLYAARHLCGKAGFRPVRERRWTQWGHEVNEQRSEHHSG